MEKLYNNVILEDNFTDTPNDFKNVPYLKNPPEVIDITVGRQLFVDDFLIEDTDLEVEYHQVEKFEGNPVLKPETDWEKEINPSTGPRSGGVWYDEEEKIFKMWYEAGWCNKLCYSTSEDGIHWRRDDLGEVRGSNIIIPYTLGGYEYVPPFDRDLSYLRPDTTTVFIDYNAPKEEKYKLFLRNLGGRDFHPIIATSSDGIHFENMRYAGVVHDRSTMFYNPFRKKWVFSVRWQEWLTDEFERCRYYIDFDNYLDAEEWPDGATKPWMNIDDLDTPHPEIQQTPHLYNVDCVGYESIMLGMFMILYGPTNKESAQAGLPKLTELIPMYSRDGYHFSRPNREPLIKANRNDKTSWERGYVQSAGGVCIINGDELWIYYLAFGGDENMKCENEAVVCGMHRNGATGIAKLRRDGFTSMNGQGTLTTRKLTMSGKSGFFVNAVGEVRAEILDENGNLLASSSTFKGDSTKAELTFDGFDVKTLNDRVFRIKFFVDGKLYSFGFADEKGDFGGAHAAGVVEK